MNSQRVRRVVALVLFSCTWASLSWAQPRPAGIRVLSPPDGAVFEPEQAVTVIVEPEGSFRLNAVAVVTKGVITGSFRPPFHVSFTAPQALGSYRLDITGKDDRDHFFDVALSYRVESALPVAEIKVPYPPFHMSTERQITVLGIFVDGVTRDITRSREIRYASSNPEVATVTSDGLIEAIDNGTTTVTASYKGQTFSFPVKVDDKKVAVPIDIKPGSGSNVVNVNAKGRLPVAVYSTPSFNAGLLRPETVRFGPGRANAVAGPAGRSADADADDEDGDSRNPKTPAILNRHIEDLNGDRLPDLLLHFRISETGLTCTDTEAALTGVTLRGERVIGIAPVRPIGPDCP